MMRWGGGWDTLTVNSGFPVDQLCGIAVSVLVPWNATNERHSFEIEVVTGDGAKVANIGGQFEVGRPPGILAGQDQRWQFAGNIGLRFDRDGTYKIIARLDGDDAAQSAFRVIPGPLLRAQREPDL